VARARQWPVADEMWINALDSPPVIVRRALCESGSSKQPELAVLESRMLHKRLSPIADGLRVTLAARRPDKRMPIRLDLVEMG